MAVVTVEQKKAFIENVDKLVQANNLNVRDACTKLGRGWSQYYKYKKDLGQKTKRATRKVKASPQPSLVTMPLSVPAGDRLVILIGSTQDVTSALDKLVQLGS